MKRLLVSIVAIFSTIGFTAVTEFPSGLYFGEGKYITSSGQQGTYSSYADVFFDEWRAAYMRDGQLMTYKATFDFANHGFFNVQVIKYGSTGKKTTHRGHGYCVESACHLSAELDHGTLEETVTFINDENRLERLGSLRYVDKDGNQQTSRWEENMMDINYSFDSNDDEEDETRR